jgi:glycerol-3-phosphate dehydrogenase
MARILDWDAQTTAREIQHYDARVEAERESQMQPDDRTADAARLGAPDVRMGGGEAGRIPAGGIRPAEASVIELDRLRRAD